MKKLLARTRREEKAEERQVPFKYEQVPFKYRQVPSRYQRLEKDEIRLLQLHGAYHGHGDAMTLSADLKTIRLHDNEGSASTKFEALSYCWGTEKEFDRKLLLNGTPFFITPNLDAALRELRKGRIERSLWVDAICINQADVDEQNEQVRIMSSIYRQAEKVIIWIGPAWPGGKDVGAEVIKEFVRLQRRGTDFQQLSSFLDNPNRRVVYVTEFETKSIDYTGGHWPVLVDFFDRPWWRRVWVRQELAMSQRAVVQCGDSVVDWMDVAAISNWLRVCVSDLDERSRKYPGKIWVGGMLPPPLKSVNHRSGAYDADDLEYFRQALADRGEIDFQTMLIHARDCESTDPRDKVYSILGMTSGAANDIEVDYALPLSAVAVQAFRKQASHSKSLDALIWSQNPGSQDSIPSWAPNLDSSFSIRPSRLKGKASSLYNASGSLQRMEQFEFLEDGHTLSVEGVIIFDRIEHLSPMPHQMGRPKDDQLDVVMSVWKPLVFKWLGTMETEQRYERFMSALTFDRDIRNRRLPKRSEGLDWDNFFRVNHLSVRARTEFEYLALAVRRSSFEGTTSGQTELNAWLKLCAESIGGRRMTMTTEGRIGLVPAVTQQGDIVCLLGLDVPFVLRKIDADNYIVIGEAYIHGVMDGEIVSSLGSSSPLQLQNIKLQ